MQKRRLQAVLVVLFVVFCFCFPSCAYSRPRQQVVVRVGVYEDYPFIFTSGQNKVQGIYADILRFIAAHEGLKLEYVKGTFEEGLKRLESGSIDVMTSIAYSPERAERFDFNNKAVFTNWGILYKRTGLNVDSILDLEGLTVAIEAGDIYGQYFKGLVGQFGIKCRFIKVSSVQGVFEAVLKGEAACGVVNRIFGKLQESNYPVEATNVIFKPVELRFAFPRGKSNTLRQIIDFHLAQMQKDPQSVLNKSLAKWLGGVNEENPIPSWVYVLMVVLGILVIALSMGGYRVLKENWDQARELLANKRELIRQKTFFEKLFEGIPDAVALEDPLTFKVIKINRTFTDMFGYSPEEAEGKVLRNLVVPEDRMNEADLHIKMAREGKNVERVTIRKSKEGRDIHVLFKQIPIILDGRFEVILNTYTDVGHLAELARKYKIARDKAREDLEQAERLWEETIEILAEIVEMRDPYTCSHQKRVSYLAAAIAIEMGLPKEAVRLLRLAGLIHDIGKIAVPSEILNKPGALSDIEMEIIRTHPQKGYELLMNMSRRTRLAEIVYQHHERLDGSGYPRGLSGDAICLEARILAVADVMEAMLSHRPYRSAFSLDEVIAEITEGKGLLYDARVVDACVRLFKCKGFTLDSAP